MPELYAILRNRREVERQTFDEYADAAEYADYLRDVYSDKVEVCQLVPVRS